MVGGLSQRTLESTIKKKKRISSGGASGTLWCVAHPVAPARQERVLQCPHPPLPKPHVPGGPGMRGMSAWNGEAGTTALVKECFWGFGWVFGGLGLVWLCLGLSGFVCLAFLCPPPPAEVRGFSLAGRNWPDTK